MRASEIVVRSEEVLIREEKTKERRASLGLYCEKLDPLLDESADLIHLIRTALFLPVDQIVGEVSAIAFVGGFDVYDQPKGASAMLLSELSTWLQSIGLSPLQDAAII